MYERVFDAMIPCFGAIVCIVGAIMEGKSKKMTKRFFVLSVCGAATSAYVLTRALNVF